MPTHSEQNPEATFSGLHAVPDAVEIPLTLGKVTTVDSADYPALSQFLWYAKYVHGLWYAVRNGRRNEKSHSIRMHNQILGVKPVDHRDGDGLNNRRQNLRPATTLQNQWNRSVQKNNVSGFKGVSLQSRCTHKWRARIRVEGRQLFLGEFFSPEEAAKAYDAAASQYFGEFARLNFPT
jgi:hypothetical protein